MTQIELETRLSEIEATYTSRISDHDADIKNHKIRIEQLHADHDADIKNHKIRIEQLHADHDMAVSKEKQHILNIESMISSLKALTLEKKTEVYKQFLAEQNDTL